MDSLQAFLISPLKASSGMPSRLQSPALGTSTAGMSIEDINQTTGTRPEDHGLTLQSVNQTRTL